MSLPKVEIFQCKSGRRIRWAVWGQSGPLRVHIEGIGCGIESAQNNSFVTYHANNIGAVLCVELANQSDATYRCFPGEVSLKEQGTDLHELISSVLIDRHFDQVKLWSGHSFGATVLLSAAINGLLPAKSRLQLLSPYSHCYLKDYVGNRSAFVLDTLKQLAGIQFIESGLASVLFSRLRNTCDPKIAHLTKNKKSIVRALRLGSSVLGFSVFRRNLNYLRDMDIDILTALDDEVISPRIHWRVFRYLNRRRVRAKLTCLSKESHFFPYECSESLWQTWYQSKKRSRNKNEVLLYESSRGWDVVPPRIILKSLKEKNPNPYFIRPLLYY